MELVLMFIFELNAMETETPTWPEVANEGKATAEQRLLLEARNHSKLHEGYSHKS